jgi:hypothetical protein
MNREEILESLERFETETGLKAWSFQIEKKFYQVAEYGGVYRVPTRTSIWETNKRGKRLGDYVFTMDGQDRIKCINLYLDKLEEAEIEKEINSSLEKEN